MIDMLVGPLTGADVPALCERLRVLAETNRADVIVCEVGALDADLSAVETLSRLQLTARRVGRRVQLLHASHELEALLELCGLRDVLLCEESGLQAQWQTEQREHARGVEERHEPGDAAG